MKAANQGFSLLELLVASFIGLIAISIIGSVFLSGYKAANKRALALLLEQDVNDAFRLIKEDILRAGYVSGGSSSLKISGSTNVIYIDSDKQCLAYVYDSTFGRLYNEVMYHPSGKKLVYRSSDHEKTVSNVCNLNGAYSLIYEKQITVSHFDVEHRIISSAIASSQWITISLTAHLKNNEAVTISKSIQIKPRNWLE